MNCITYETFEVTYAGGYLSKMGDFKYLVNVNNNKLLNYKKYQRNHQTWLKNNENLRNIEQQKLQSINKIN